MDAWLAAWQIFILALVRIAAFLFLIPVLGGRLVPPVIRVATALALAVFAFRYWLPVAGSPLAALPFGLLVAKETAVGLAMAFTLVLVFAAFQVAGELIGFQMMFSAATVFSLGNAEQTTVTGQLASMVAILIFFTLNGQFALMGALELSFSLLPVGAWPGGFGGPGVWAALSERVFETGLRLALPLLAALFITNLALGLIARTMPQINVFVIGMPLQVAAGFVLFMLLLGDLGAAEQGILRQWTHDLRGLLHALRP